MNFLEHEPSNQQQASLAKIDKLGSHVLQLNIGKTISKWVRDPSGKILIFKIRINGLVKDGVPEWEYSVSKNRRGMKRPDKKSGWYTI